MEEKKVRVSWIKNGNDYQRVEGECDNVETLPVGIYTVHLSEKRGWWLEFYREKFTFDYKVYGCDEGFIDYFMKTYKNTNGNIGAMFNGVKGTGKTVTAKILANTLNIPVIIVKGMGDMNLALVEFLSSFNFDCVYFFDEFEKNFKEDDASVLQLMDGVYNSEFRKVFLLTTNRTWVNENLLSRPSRIRYIKEFKNISRKLIDEYIADNLIDKTATEDVITYIDGLDVSTIDILKTAIQEINIHGKEAFRANMKHLNAELMTIKYLTYRLPVSCDQGLRVEDFLLVVDEVKKMSIGMMNCNSSAIFEPKSYGGDVDVELGTIDECVDKEFNAILPSSGYTKSGKLKDETIESLARCTSEGWKVNSTIPFKRLKVGNEWCNETIVYIDAKRCVIVTEVDGSLAYYYITNPEEQKSNYNENYNKYTFLY